MIKIEEEESVYLSEDDSENGNIKTRLTLSTNQATISSLSPQDKIKHEYGKAIESLKQKPVFNSKSELTCRDQEKQKVELFLMHCLNTMGKTSLPSLYICGVPGIGKTLTMLTVSDWFTKQHFGHVKCIYVNGMQMRRVSKVYSVILKKLVKRKSKKPYHYLDLLLTQNKEYPHQQDIALIQNKLKIIIIDEIDYFLQQKYQQTLFQFLEWTNNIKTKMVLIGLSNTINFVEKLNHKINSRMQLSVNLLFQSYSPQQVEIILRSRLGQSVRLFTNESLARISQIIGRFSSDIRSALNLTEKALLIALDQSLDGGSETKVTQKHVQQSIQPNPAFQILKLLAKIQKIVLLVLIDIKVSQSDDQSELICSKFINLCGKHFIEVDNSYHTIRQILQDLRDIKAIEIKGPRRWDRHSQYVYFEKMAISVYPNVAEYIEKSSEYIILK